VLLLDREVNFVVVSGCIHRLVRTILVELYNTAEVVLYFGYALCICFTIWPSAHIAIEKLV
jgi:hypothetical protein